MFEEFSPPDKGLNQDEEIVWSQRGGMNVVLMFGGGFCIVFSPWILLLIYGWFGGVIGNFVLVLILVGLLLTAMEFVNAKRTKYYLTTERIVEVRGGLIQAQISLSNLNDSPDSNTIEVKPTYNEGSTQYYAVQINDPVSGNSMVLDGLDEDARDIILTIDD